MTVFAKSVFVGCWLAVGIAAVGTVANASPAEACPDDAVCFEPGSQYFDSSNLEPLLKMLGLTGDEPFSCAEVLENYLCRQQAAGGIPTSGFHLSVNTWSRQDDIRFIRCNCLSADIDLPEFDLTQEQAAALASRFVKAHLLSHPATPIEFLDARLLLAAKPPGRTGFNVVWDVRLGLQTPERKPGVINLHVDTRTERVVRALDSGDVIGRKGFLTRPWDELRDRLSASPKDLALFREYLSYGAFRGRGDVEARFQDAHRTSLAEIDPDGESFYLAVPSVPMGLEDVVALLDSADAVAHELTFMLNEDGRIAMDSVRDLACSHADLPGAVNAKLSQLLLNRNDWHVPEFLGVTSDQSRSRSLQGLRFAFVRLQANHVRAARLWDDARDRLLALIPLTSPGPHLPLPPDEMQCTPADSKRQ